MGCWRKTGRRNRSSKFDAAEVSLIGKHLLAPLVNLHQSGINLKSSYPLQ